MNITNHHNKTKILVVDDTPIHLKALIIQLQNLKFEVQIAHNGEEALNQVAPFQPDLILLDVLMPKMDGFETCRHLKSKAETCAIPVIFMTALDDNINKIKGFDSGGVDYVTKPVHHEELIARVTTHLKLRQLQQTLEENNQELQKQNQKLARIAHIIAHDLKDSLHTQTNTVKRLAHILTDKYLAKRPDLEPMAISQLIQETSTEMLEVMDKLLVLTNHTSD
jgi:PleD family two-component response regulator